MTDQKQPQDSPQNAVNLPTDSVETSPDSQTNQMEIMTGQTGPSDTPKINKVNQNEKAAGRKYNPIKKPKSRIIQDPDKPKKIKQDQLVKWSVFVQEETKTAVGKAVDKAGITVTEWVDSRLRQAATDELSKKSKPPAKVEDVADLLKAFTDGMRADQAATLQAQNDLIQQQGQQIAALAEAVQSNQPKSLKEMIFGKSKAD